MNNPFNIIKRKALQTRKCKEAEKAGIEIASRAKAEGWTPDRTMREIDCRINDMLRRELNNVIGKDIDQMVQALLQNIPKTRAKDYENPLRKGLMEALLEHVKTGKEPDFEGIICNAVGERRPAGKPQENRFKLPQPMTKEEVLMKMARASAVVKLMCGVGNNAAWLVTLEAYDHVKQHRRYNQSMKGGKRVSWYFRRVMNLYHDYEDRLLNTQVNRMFHLADMDEKIRRRYGDITDQEFFDFWRAMGVPVYTETHPLVTSLWNKYRLSLVNNGIEEADKVAWAMTAEAVLQLAVTMYGEAIKDCEEGYGLPRDLLEHVFGQFSMKQMAEEWYNAMTAIAPETKPVKLTEVEEKNIELGIRQLMEAWLSNDTLYRAAADTAAEYDEVFATAGFQKKALREIAAVREETRKKLEETKQL